MPIPLFVVVVLVLVLLGAGAYAIVYEDLQEERRINERLRGQLLARDLMTMGRPEHRR